MGGAGRGRLVRDTAGRRRRYRLARGRPSSAHARLVRTSGTSSSNAAPVTCWTAARCPRSRRAAPRAHGFSHDLQRRLRAGQLGLQPLVAAAHPLQLDLLSAPPRSAALGGQPGQRPGIPSATPLHNVGGVQALTAQQRALIARLGQPVVLGQDRQLVLRAEPAPARPCGRVISHDAIMRRHKGGGHAHDQRSCLALRGIKGYYRCLTSA